MSVKSIKIGICCLLCGILMSAMSGCVSNECLDNKNSLPLAGFYSSLAEPQQISIDGLTIYGYQAPGDSILLQSGLGVSSLYLPFRIDEPSTTYIFHYEQEGIDDEMYNDTVRFDYDIIPYFVSSACGSIYKYRVNKISHTRHLMDSVVCTAHGGLIDNVAVENLRIYFRVGTQEAPAR